MSFANSNELAIHLEVNKNTIPSKRKQYKIPYLKRGKMFYHLRDFEKTIQVRDSFQKKKLCKVITLGNNKGGVAKTTSVINISSTLAFYGYKVLMIDMDMQCNLSRHFNKKDSDNNIITALEGKDISIFNLENTNYPFGKLDLIINDLSLESRFDKFSATKLDKVLSNLKSEYDFIIIDTPPSIRDITPQCLDVSDYAFMPLKPDAYSTSGAINFIELIDKHKVKLLGGIITSNNKRFISDSINISEIENIFNSVESTICSTHISNSTIFSEVSMLSKHSVLDLQPKHKCCEEYLKVTDFMLDNINKGIK